MPDVKTLLHTIIFMLLLAHLEPFYNWLQYIYFLSHFNENLTFYFQRNWFSFHNVFICFFVSYKFCFVNQGTCSLKNKLNKVFCISTLSITSYFIFCIYFAKNNYYILNWVSYCNNRIKTPSFKFQTIHKKIIKTFKKNIDFCAYCINLSYVYKFHKSVTCGNSSNLSCWFSCCFFKHSQKHEK